MKKYDRLVTNGCSFVFGTGLVMGENTFGHYLSRTMNCKYTNLSDKGTSNNRIFRTTFDYIFEKNNNERVLLIIGLSHWSRVEFYSVENDYYFTHYKELFENSKSTGCYIAGKWYKKSDLENLKRLYEGNFTSESSGQQYVKQNIIPLNVYSKTKNIDVVIFGSLMDVPKELFDEVLSYDMEGKLNWITYLKDKKDPQKWLTECSHPSDEAHNEMSNLLFNFLGDNNG